MISSGAGDALCQIVVEKRSLDKYDVPRTIRFMVLPTFFMAPVLNRWYRVLQRIGGPPKLVPLKQVLIDQTLFAPWFTATVITSLRLLEGFSLEESWEKMRQDYWSIYKRAIFYWPCVQLFNFYLMPVHFQVIWVQLAGLFWNVFLSNVTQTKLPVPPIE
uniref:Mitochondrial inner membrane protein Mpv17 n=1 Tax=Acrobeloides nanus TaxID=290746 RepID=A0A914CYS6_9BILA